MVLQIPAAAIATVGHHVRAIDTQCHDARLIPKPSLWFAKFLYFCVKPGGKIGTDVAQSVRGPVGLVVWSQRDIHIGHIALLRKYPFGEVRWQLCSS